ncbi:unnamed protein product [Agarophyton chilense]
MLASEWMRICSLLRCKEDISTLAKAQPDIGYDTISLIYDQLYARQVAKTFYLVRMHSKAFVEMFKSGLSLMEISERFNLSPSLVARKVLELHLDLNRKSITQFMRDPSNITDERLRDDVELCVEMDEHCSPRMDRLRTALGLEYELRLIHEVMNLGLEFETENDLRKRGCHKTPDILLYVPVLFRNKVVRWIDSKAKFGDEYTLNKDYVSSVSSYLGRFGPGMVIYWFGFIEDCNSRMLLDNGLLITGSFPADVGMLPGSNIFLACKEDDEANESEDE